MSKKASGRATTAKLQRLCGEAACRWLRKVFAEGLQLPLAAKSITTRAL
jgi:hypothetical protein